ncbi:C40 family peptidase, partial [Salmonella enterica]|uniref:C40 family peptidase n=1 Tax=Salmonella enterica TaxID=28901 RepID=UPI0028DF3251
MQELLDYAASSQDEVCALILGEERVFRCRNVHPEPWHHFRISDDDWLAAEEEGEIIAVFHSHPQSQPVLSGSDRQMQVMTGLPWWLASGGQLRKYRPVPWHCCKVSDEAAFCLIQRPYISKTLLTRRIS